MATEHIHWLFCIATKCQIRTVQILALLWLLCIELIIITQEHADSAQEEPEERECDKILNDEVSKF